VTHVAAPLTALAAKAPREKPPHALRASKLFHWLATASGKQVPHAVLCDKHSSRSGGFFPKSFPWPVDATSLPSVAPPKARWQSPASWSVRHACLGECDASPRAQIPQPACSAISLRAHPGAPVQSFFSPAYASLPRPGRPPCAGLLARSGLSLASLRTAIRQGRSAQLRLRFQPMLHIAPLRTAAFDKNFIRPPRNLFVSGCGACGCHVFRHNFVCRLIVQLKPSQNSIQLARMARFIRRHFL
jgi:hypothetical protein